MMRDLDLGVLLLLCGSLVQESTSFNTRSMPPVPGFGHHDGHHKDEPWPCTVDPGLLPRLCGSLATCRGRCGPRHSTANRLCQCDAACRLYGDCCHDLDLWCGHLKDQWHFTNLTLEPEKVECSEDAIPVIATCGQDQVAQKSFLESPVTSQSMNFINEGVMKCHLGNGTSNDQWNSWHRMVHVTDEKDPTEVRELVRAIVRGELHSELFSRYPYSSSKRACSGSLVSSLSCAEPNPYVLCINMTQADINARCSSITVDSSNDSLPGDSLDSLATCELIRDAQTDLTSVNLLNKYRFFEIKNNESSTTIKVYSWKGSNHVHHWKRLECHVDVDAEDNADVSKPCRIIDCLRGFFMSNGKCRAPRMLTVELYLSDGAVDNALTALANRIRLSIRNLQLQGKISLFHLGDRVEREGNFFKYTDHYTIVEIREDDTGDALPVSKTMFKDFFLLESDVISGIEALQVCFHFHDEESREQSTRCDDIIVGTAIRPNSRTNIANDNAETGNATETRAHPKSGWSCENHDCPPGKNDNGSFISSSNTNADAISRSNADGSSESEPQLKERYLAKSVNRQYDLALVLSVLFVSMVII